MDKISQMLSSIKNASMARKKSLEVDFSKECESIAKILKEKNFLSEVKVFKPQELSHKRMNLTLAYEGEMPLVTEVKRVSKPGRRVYTGYSQIRKVQGGFGIAVVSTSRGLLTGEEAKKRKLGGEVICYVS